MIPARPDAASRGSGGQRGMIIGRMQRGVTGHVVCGLVAVVVLGYAFAAVSAQSVARHSADDVWAQYRARSRGDRLADSGVLVAELRALGRSAWTVPAVSPDNGVARARPAAWYRTDSASRVAATILSFQTASGGWSKHVNMTGPPRQPGESYYAESRAWNYIATIDNGATVSELRFLEALLRAREEPVWRDAFTRGVGYLLRAQLPSGGWPQVYPLQGSYHDATTYNDDAIIGVMRLLRDVAAGSVPGVAEGLRDSAQRAFDRGIEGILADQVVIDGVRTVWGQQHDPFSRRPVAARSYELAGLTASESTRIVDLLLELDSPSASVVTAVHAAAAWLMAHPVRGIRYDDSAKAFVNDPKAPDMWARVYELPSLRPVVANRDGIPRYNVDQLTDRRSGYAWFTNDPASMLRRYTRWATRHPKAP